MSDLLNQFLSITSDIEHEEQYYIGSLISHFQANDKHEEMGKQICSNFSINKTLPHHEENMLCLLCLRIKINGQLIKTGNSTYADTFSEDLNKIFVNAKYIEHSCELTDEVIDHIWDLLMAVCPEHKSLLFPRFKNCYKKGVRRPTPFTPDLYLLFMSISQAYELLGKRNYSISILENLCQLSEKRNECEIHREIISMILGVIWDRAPKETVRIAKLNLKYNEHSYDAYAGDFFWFYGCALRMLTNTSEAIIAFEKCYKVRNVVYGSDSWFTAITKCELSLLIYASSKDLECRSFILEFIDNMENGLYAEPDKQLREIVEGEALYRLLMFQTNAPSINDYDIYISKYEKICSLYDGADYPLVKIRLARNLRGAYYLWTGDYILAEQAFLDALNLNDTAPGILTDTQIKTNLLLVYNLQNDFQMIAKALPDLLDLTELDRSVSRLSEKDKYRIYTLALAIVSQTMVELDHEYIDKIKIFLTESCNSVLSLPPALATCTEELAVFICCAAMFILQNECASRNELYVYLNALDQIYKKNLIFPLNKLQRTNLVYVAALLSWTLNDYRLEKFFSESLRLSDESMVPLPIKAAISQSYATFSAKKK